MLAVGKFDEKEIYTKKPAAANIPRNYYGQRLFRAKGFIPNEQSLSLFEIADYGTNALGSGWSLVMPNVVIKIPAVVR